MKTHFAIFVAVSAALAACAPQQRAAPVAAAGPSPQITSVPRTYPADKLVGMDEQNLGRLLGSPGLLRSDGPAEIWQFVDETCILDVFLYRSGGRFVVDYVEARPAREDGGSTAADVQACLDAILTDRQPLTS